MNRRVLPPFGGSPGEQGAKERARGQSESGFFRYDVVAVGAAAIDIIARVDDFPRADRIILASEVTREAGGSTANIAVRLAQLGQKTAFAGLLADDEQGCYLRRVLAGEGVDTELITNVASGRTACTVVMVKPDGERAILSLGGTALYTDIDQVPPGVWEGKVLYIGEAYLPVVRRLVAGASARGQYVFYGPGGIFVREGWDALAGAARGAKGLFLNREECMALLGEEEGTPSWLPKLAEWLAQAMRKRRWWESGIEEIVVTLGAWGCVWVSAEDFCFQPALRASVVDTTGAGDAFVAGYLAGYLKGWSVQDRLKLATACASLAIEGPGPRYGRLSFENVAVRLQQLGDAVSDDEAGFCG